MSNQSILGSLDPEVMERMQSRRAALGGLGRMGAGLALASVPLALAATAKSVFAQGGLPQGIVDVLNFALTLEHLEAEFYKMGVAAANLIPAADRTIFTTIRDHEVAHVEFLMGALGSRAVAKPTFDFTAGGMFNPFGDYTTFRLLAQAFEDTGVRAYKGQAPNLIENDQILQAALTIHSVEARHAAEVRRLNGLQGWIPLSQPGLPAAAAPVYQGEAETTQMGINVPTRSGVSAEAVSEAFDEPLTKEQVLAIAKPFIKS